MRSRTAFVTVGTVLLVGAIAAGLLLAGVWSPRTPKPRAEHPHAAVTDLPALERLPRGRAPEVIWARGRTLHLPGGDTVQLPRRFLAFAPYDDGVLAIAPAGDGYEGVVLDRAGRQLDAFPTALEVAASHDGSTVLHRHRDRLLLRDNRTGDSLPLPPQGRGEPVAAAVAGRFAWFAMRRPDGRVDAFAWHRGEVTPDPEGLVRDGDGEGRRIRWRLVGDDGSCSERLDPRGRSIGETCEWTLDAFSPGGRHVLAGPAYRDGIGDRQLAILPNDAWSGRGRPVVDVTLADPAAPYVLDARWEDADSVLAILARPGGATWSVRVVRIDIDGTVEAASRIAEVPEGENPFVLGAG